MFFLSVFLHLQHIHRVLTNPSICCPSPSFSSSSARPISHLFLVGGFAESPVVQEAVRAEFAGSSSGGVRVVIPQGVGLAVLRGAVLYGLDPSVVHVRRATRTYGIGIIRPFDPDGHPQGQRL